METLMKLNQWLVAAATATVLAGSLAMAGCTSNDTGNDAATEQASVSGDQGDEASTTPGVTNYAAHGGFGHAGGYGHAGGFGHGGFGHAGYGHAGYGRGGGFDHAWGHGGWGRGERAGGWGWWRHDRRHPWWF
jgi:hypothetical protein